MKPMISGREALERLQEGNRRYAAGLNESSGFMTRSSHQDLLEGQNPFAVILGCSDSRAPVEMVFDQGLGDLFVIRIAGNIVAPSQIGSVEFAVEKFGTPLVVVMGHTRCGAVEATIEHIMQKDETRSRNLRSIVSRIRPAVEKLMEDDPGNDPNALMEKVIKANVRVGTEGLRHGSEILEKHVQSNNLLIVGAEYSLETGIVDFFDGIPG
jgi:carbonic anhydrase